MRIPAAQPWEALAAGSAIAGAVPQVEVLALHLDLELAVFAVARRVRRSEAEHVLRGQLVQDLLVHLGEVARGDEAPESVDVVVTHNGATLTSLTVPRHDEGIPTPYYPVVFTPPEPGDYEVKASFAEKATPFKVAAPGDLTLLQVGQPMRPVVTPTSADARGVTPICTRSEPCPFHAVTLTDALAAAKPVALIVSTPGYCQTAICGPVLDLLVEAAGSIAGIDVIHNEVYANPDAVASLDQATPAPLVEAYSMVFEPCLFVVDADGTLVRRLDTIYDRTELRAAISALS